MVDVEGWQGSCLDDFYALESRGWELLYGTVVFRGGSWFNERDREGRLEECKEIGVKFWSKVFRQWVRQRKKICLVECSFDVLGEGNRLHIHCLLAVPRGSRNLLKLKGLSFKDRVNESWREFDDDGKIVSVQVKDWWKDRGDGLIRYNNKSSTLGLVPWGSMFRLGGALDFKRIERRERDVLNIESLTGTLGGGVLGRRGVESVGVRIVFNNGVSDADTAIEAVRFIVDLWNLRLFEKVEADNSKGFVQVLEGNGLEARLIFSVYGLEGDYRDRIRDAQMSLAEYDFKELNGVKRVKIEHWTGLDQACLKWCWWGDFSQKRVKGRLFKSGVLRSRKVLLETGGEKVGVSRDLMEKVVKGESERLDAVGQSRASLGLAEGLSGKRYAGIARRLIEYRNLGCQIFWAENRGDPLATWREVLEKSGIGRRNLIGLMLAVRSVDRWGYIFAINWGKMKRENKGIEFRDFWARLYPGQNSIEVDGSERLIRMMFSEVEKGNVALGEEVFVNSFFEKVVLDGGVEGVKAKVEPVEVLVKKDRDYDRRVFVVDRVEEVVEEEVKVVVKKPVVKAAKRLVENAAVAERRKRRSRGM